MNKEFLKATLVRMVRTFAETALSYMGTAALLSEVNWLGVLSAGCMGAVTAFLLAVSTGLPETENKRKTE